MTVQPLVSIGIPTYNRPDELRRTLHGIVGQTYKNLEIIVSDNASPNDATELVVREFVRQDSRIKYFRQTENRGAVFNFQFVLDKASGELFMWAADDDYRAPTFVEELVDLLCRHPECTLAFCDFMEVDESGSRAQGYPNHLPLLQSFTVQNRACRMLRYFFQLETKGKANLIYGLMRKATLKNFEWQSFVRKYGEYGTDMLFVFGRLCEGSVALTDKRLYRCTVGNKKDYVAPAPLSVSKKLVAPFLGLAKQLHYSMQYLRLAQGWMRVVLVVFWPFKALDIILRIFLPTEIQNLYQRLVRRLFNRSVP